MRLGVIRIVRDVIVWSCMIHRLPLGLIPRLVICPQRRGIDHVVPRLSHRVVGAVQMKDILIFFGKVFHKRHGNVANGLHWGTSASATLRPASLVCQHAAALSTENRPGSDEVPELCGLASPLCVRFASRVGIPTIHPWLVAWASCAEFLSMPTIDRREPKQATHIGGHCRAGSVQPHSPPTAPPAWGFVHGAPLPLFPTSPPPQGAPRLRSGTAPAAHVRSGLLSRGETGQGPPSLEPQGTPNRFPPAPPILLTPPGPPDGQGKPR